MTKEINLKFIALAVLFLIVLIFTRFYNLDYTARFIWDESSDLVKIHQYYIDKTITLVGPISEDGSKVFGSLTYYMLMPFAVLGKFDPVSTANGDAFWGIITVLLILFLTYLVNKKLLPLIALLTLIWFPLVQTERWAWNPNLIPLSAALGLILYMQKRTWSFFLSGICLGLMIHLHYLALLSISGFILVNIGLWIKRELRFINLLYFCFGIILAVIPFIIFDLRHPPGLFFSRILYFNHTSTNISFIEFINKLALEIQTVLLYFTSSILLAYIEGIMLLILIYEDIRTKNKSLIYLIPFIIQLVGLVFFDSINDYYILPAILFFLAWVIFPRQKKLSKNLVKIIITLLIIGGSFTIYSQLTQSSWQSNIVATRQISNIIAQQITDSNLKNVEISVIRSSDPNPYGRRYRDLLQVKGVGIMDKDAYSAADHLFVVSSGTEIQIREDPADVMSYFKNGPLINKWIIPNSLWTLYLFNRN